VTANHYVEAYNNSRPGDEAQDLAARARSSLVDAAERAISFGGWAQAQGLLEKAVEITGDAPESGALLHKAGVAATSSGDTLVGIDHLLAATERLRAIGDTDLLAEAQRQLGIAYFFASRLDEAEELLLAAIEELEDPTTSPAAASLYAQLARIYVFKADYEKGEAYVNRAMPPAEMNEEVSVIADALITRGVASVYQGRVHEAEALLKGALSLAEDHGLSGQRSRALINIAANQLYTDPAEALRTAQSGLDSARRIGNIDNLAFLLGNAQEAALQLADWDLSAQLAAQIEELAGASTHFVMLGPLALLSALRGETEAAERYTTRFAELVTESSSYEDRRGVDALRCAVELLQGHEKAALDAARGMNIFDHEFSGLFGFVGRAALWAGDEDMAEATLDFEMRSTLRNPWQRCRVKTLEAGIAALKGRREEALSLYQETLVQWSALGLPLGKAFCQMDMALLVGGDESRDAASEAEAFFNDAGNHALVARLHQSQRSDPDLVG
jgi:tetratricopeptide (TPR) repeat protein